MGPYYYIRFDFSLTLCPLQGRLRHIYMYHWAILCQSKTLTLCQSRLYPSERDFGFGLSPLFERWCAARPSRSYLKVLVFTVNCNCALGWTGPIKSRAFAVVLVFFLLLLKCRNLRTCPSEYNDWCKGPTEFALSLIGGSYIGAKALLDI